MTTATESLLRFLRAKIDRGEHRGPDLLERFLQFAGEPCAMETQVNVACDDGEPVAGKRSTYTDGVNTWFSFRIPKAADSDPQFKDFTIKFPLDVHCEGIGSTGWDWKARRSRWVGFDVDSLVGHAEGVGIADDELERVKEAACKLPYVEVRKSTGGGGLHLYVLFADTETFNTANHTEHAALARAVLGVMSRDSGHRLESQIDVCGGNMWLWHRKSRGTEGLALVKPAACLFTDELLPTNWRDHTNVVKREVHRVRLPQIGDAEIDVFEQLASAHHQTALDDAHKAVIDEIANAGFACEWDHDHWLLRTHTCGFQHVIENKTEELGIEGVFKTNSKGQEPLSPNCFAFPQPNGSWKVVRFGLGTNEDPTWRQSEQGWTTCWFNRKANWETTARALGGRETVKGGYEFDTLAQAIQVARLLNPAGEYEVDPAVRKRKAVVYRTKDCRLAIELPKSGKDEERPDGLWNDSDKKTAWTQIFGIEAEPTRAEAVDFDNVVRRLQTTDGQAIGWAVRQRKSGAWSRAPASELKWVLQARGLSKSEAEEVLGRCAEDMWTVVCRPFEPEYPPNRQWNIDAPQYRCPPASRAEAGTEEEQGENSRHPHWDLVFEHIGADTTKYLKELEWAKQYGIRTGADYLRAIFASILREPFEPTPYLFLFGPENSGKSILHEAFELLVTRGVEKADRALTSNASFNGELEKAILCVVEETNVSRSPGAHSRIKDFVTSRRVSIRKMRTDSYMIDNMTHWIQCANDQSFCPIFDGDTRITMVYVDSLAPGQEIPKTRLMKKLQEEAPHFMRTLLDMQLPPPSGRLRIPVVETQHKQRAAELTRSSLEHFLSECVHEVPGELILFSEFYQKFIDWLPLDEKGMWSRIKVSRALPVKFQSGAGNANKTYIINASWEPKDVPADTAPYFVVNGRVKRHSN